MIKTAPTPQQRRVQAAKASALVVLFVLVSFAPWAKKDMRQPVASYAWQVSR